MPSSAVLKRTFSVILLIVFLSSQVTDQRRLAGQDKAPQVSPAKLGETRNVHRSGKLYLAGQFSPDDVKELKKAGIRKVISLRTAGEIEWDENEVLKAAGIEFINFPLRKPESFNDEMFGQVRRILRESKEPILLHCASANRVGGVWLTFRVLDQGVDLPTALREAAEVGLKAEFIRDKAVEYIKRKQDEKSDKQSVKPGINKSFLDPELDVEQFVKRFEIESREVYAQRHKILKACEINEGDVVADVGAGTGLFTQLFSVEVGEKGWVHAVDIAPRFLRHIQDAAAKAGHNNISTILCAEDNAMLPANSVDVIFICDTYHHFEYPLDTMKSLHRALKNDGHLILIDFHRIEGKTRPWLLNHVRAGQDVFRKEIESSGFRLAEEKSIPGFQENYFLKFVKKSR